VTDLEKLATALYVIHERNGTANERRTARERAARINELKPHISIAEAQRAVAELDELIIEAAPLILPN
jgi:hypothetical protein